MTEWERFFFTLLCISTLFFMITDTLIYQSLLDKNIKTLHYQKEIQTLVSLRKENESLKQKYQAQNKESVDLDVQLKKIESEIEKLQAEEKKLKDQLIQKKQSSVENSYKTVYLTFDDGPSDRTEEILNILDKYHVKATFFVTYQDEKYDHLIKRMYKEGHTIGLHTASHNYREVYASEEAYFADLKRIQDKVYDLTGYRSVIIRFPGGSSNTVSRFNPGIMTRLTKLVTEQGYYYHDWNVDSEDAAGAGEERQMNNIRNYSPKHDIINLLMHDAASKHATVNSLEDKIKYYIENGYAIEPLTPISPCMHHGINN